MVDLGWVWEKLLVEGRVIKDAPMLFIVGLMVVATIFTWIAHGWLESRYLDRIENRDAQIQLLGEQLAATRQHITELRETPQPPKPTKIDTILVLQYSGGEETPVQLADSNLHRWYSLENILSIHKLSDIGVEERSKTATITNLLWIFHQPISYKQPLVSFSGGSLPRYEVKDRTDRYVLFAFSGQIPRGVLELSLKQ
jgi:hypothetical protein